MDNEPLFPFKADDLEALEQLSLIDTPEPETLIQLQAFGDQEADTDHIDTEDFQIGSGFSYLNQPSNILGRETDDNILLESDSNSWDLIRSVRDTPTDFSGDLSLQSFEQEGLLDDLLALDPRDYDSIFQYLPQDALEPENIHKAASYQGALISDIDIAAELVAELCKLELDDHQPEELPFDTLFDIYPYCQPCQENLSAITEFDSYTFSDSVFLPIVQTSHPTMDPFNTSSRPCHSPDEPSQDSQSTAMYHSIISSFTGETKNERVYLGHKETIFGMSFSPCGQFVATASQDSTIRIWSSTNNKMLSTLNAQSNKYECLRVVWASYYWVQQCESLWTHDVSDGVGSSLMLASAGADGIVQLWHSVDDAKNWNCISLLDHFSPDAGHVENKDETEEEKEKEKPQIYSIQFIDEWTPCHNPSVSNNFKCPYCFLTSSDDFIHLWEPQSFESGDNDIAPGQLIMTRIMSIRFTSLDMGFGGTFVLFSGDESKENPNTFHYPQIEIDLTTLSKNAYGGPRNPDHLIYVFDASYCQTNGLLGIALSDGSLRLVNGRGSCVSVLQLPECKARLTSFCWHSSGQRLATCVATGQIILWSILVDSGGRIEPSCTAVLEGGHTRGRPLYGVRYLGTKRQVGWKMFVCITFVFRMSVFNLIFA